MIKFSIDNDNNRAIVIAVCGGMMLGSATHPGYSVTEVVALIGVGLAAVYSAIAFLEK